MTIAGGIMGALFHRERTGEATTVDVSLLGVGLWSMGQALSLSLLLDKPWTPPPANANRANPLSANYQTKDNRYLAFTCLQAGKYWSAMCKAIGRPDLASDPRFTDHASLLANSTEAAAILRASFAQHTLEEWREKLADFTGQWAVVQDSLEAATDPQAAANGYVQECRTADGTVFGLAAAPVQYDDQPATPRRAPAFNEHGDQILADLGFDRDAIADLKIRGVIA
jgi:crotonobetainyl-CoA:carnitine CoA-transferase CaiB-like acyl-CoA transferase